MHVCAYTSLVRYEWDPRKASANARKHGVAFADAVGALEHELALTRSDEGSQESRFVTIGMDCLARVVVVV